MAFSLGDRFAKPPKYYRLLDPGAYDTVVQRGNAGRNSVPFLSKGPRKIQIGTNIWTDVLYDARIIRKIPNCSALMSKLPRFTYKPMNIEDSEEMLCNCGMHKSCICTTNKQKKLKSPDIICQGKVKRRIFKGRATYISDENLSFIPIKEECPPFYDTKVNEATEFYRGCKWSKRIANISQYSLEIRPGPADYFLEKTLNKDEICAENLRALKRKTSKQLRYIDMLQQKNILENHPGPSTYTPKMPKCTNLQQYGPTADRFPKPKHEARPGPADHEIKRDFDATKYPEKICHAILPIPAAFGTKQKRFNAKCYVGPGPASYNLQHIPCSITRCSSAPFGSSAERFKVITEKDTVLNNMSGNIECQEIINCPKPTWVFKSKTIRMKPAAKTYSEPSPVDRMLTASKKIRSPIIQYKAPFFSSEGRFHPWHNNIPVHGQSVTIAPGYYSPEKPKCPPAFHYGPLLRAPRFHSYSSETPAPDVYNIDGGVDCVLNTHNTRLKENVKNMYRFRWTPPFDVNSLSYEQREAILFNKTMTAFSEGLPNEEYSFDKNVLNEDVPRVDPARKQQKRNVTKPKMLRTFLYGTSIQRFF